MDTGNKSNNNKVIIVLLSVLIVAVLGIGGFFIVRTLTSDNNQNTSESSTSNSTSSNTQQPTNNSSTPTNNSAPSETTEPIEAGFTYTEVRGNDYYIEVQTNGAIAGTCDISLVPTNGTNGHHDTDDLEMSNKVSTCSEDFSLKGMNPGEHKITVVIRATDGRTTTLEKIVNI